MYKSHIAHHQLLKRGFHLYATHVTHATQGFTKGTQQTQRTQEVVNDMAGVCHVIWSVLGSNELLDIACVKLDACFGPCVACVNLAFLALRT